MNTIQELQKIIDSGVFNWSDNAHVLHQCLAALKAMENVSYSAQNLAHQLRNMGLK